MSVLSIWVQGNNVESYHLMVRASQIVLVNSLVYYFPNHCQYCNHEIDHCGACAIAIVVGWYVGDIDKVLSIILNKHHYVICTSMASHL
jgi:hypothetical protein